MTVTFTFRNVRNLVSLLAVLTVLGSAADEPAPKPFSRAKATLIIADARKIVAPNGVERLDKVRIGGIEQWVSIRGADKRNPVLLLIHGGPGYVSMPMSWWFTRGWEEYFTVVQWDQRGAGKTYLLNDPTTIGPTMTLERMVADAEEMTTWIRKELGKQKIFVIGHSWGSYLGLELAKLHPESLYAYIGVGQVFHKRGLKLDGSHPTLLHGYGSYGITYDPAFAPTALAWLERDGVIAVAHVRGGGEYGEDWHNGGRKATKENTISDFLVCAQYLINRKYTSAQHLAGEGTSAGGITIGGAITARPDLFAAALDNVGMSDDLRAELQINGPANIPEFGTVKNESDFRNLLAISAYLRIKDQTPYPAVLLTTGINDPRVDPWQMNKMTARLQSATSSKRPVLLRVDYDAGHGGIGATRSQHTALLTDQFSFLLWQLGDKVHNARNSPDTSNKE